ncbi:hypothetical protein [Ensifer sp. SSB1]|uniref:hypothetical protein n=1 Tax=Ensifer sp. SSB1 TaxID=2795385 RepID=UPI0025BD53FC|nr:hypothetical protein [Ensifer sp. SSB1]
MESLLPLFINGGNISGLVLATPHAAAFKGLALEAKSILDDELGIANDYSRNLAHTAGIGISGMFYDGGPSYASVEESGQIVRAGARAVGRKRAKAPLSQPASPKPYVDQSRISALQGLSNGPWDFVRLVELCRELNVAAANRCHLSTAMLLRAIMDHVPPVLGFGTFAEVATNYGTPKTERSFKASMQRLETSLRNIANVHLHSPIRSRVDLPTAIQVDFASDLDVLLGEVIRVSRAESD